METIGVPQGNIRDPECASQIIDYHALCYGPCSPSDIDGILELSDNVYVILEYKFRNATMSLGQEIMLSRLTDALHDAGKHAICLVAEHHHPSGEHIEAGSAIVKQYRYQHLWRVPKRTLTVKEVIDIFVHRFASEMLSRKF